MLKLDFEISRYIIKAIEQSIIWYLLVQFYLGDLVPSSVRLASPNMEDPPTPRETSKYRPTFSRRQRRNHEDHLAMIFLGFILVFLICHLPRILLDVHELVTREHYRRCMEFGMMDFPFYISVSIIISNVTLVLSSATNLLIYCSLSSTYRKEVCDYFAHKCSNLKEMIYK